MYSPYNPCCTGSFYGTGCTADCADAIAWEAYSRAWADSMSGAREVWLGAAGMKVEYVQPSAIDFGDSDPMPRHDYNWLTGEPAASQSEIDAWRARSMQHPKLDWSE